MSLAANNQTRNIVLAHSVIEANTFWLRLRGLLCRPQIQSGSGLYLEPCNSIHMFGMTYAIDAIFLDQTGKVVGLVQNIKPWHVSRLFSGAVGCLELPAGTIAASGTQLADMIELVNPEA